MAYIGTKNYYTEVSKGNVPGASIIHKFGKNSSVGTSYIPISIGGIYETPQPASATTRKYTWINSNKAGPNCLHSFLQLRYTASSN